MDKIVWNVVQYPSPTQLFVQNKKGPAKADEMNINSINIRGLIVTEKRKQLPLLRFFVSIFISRENLKLFTFHSSPVQPSKKWNMPTVTE